MKRPDEKELRKYNVYYKPDTDFASHARLLQSKWREKNGWKMNDKPKSNYGNFVETVFAKNEKVNFLTDNIKRLVVKKITEIRSNGGLVGEPRIWNNLLSSQPLCFNLFGELYYDLDLATKFFKIIFPDKISTVTKIDFEFSSRRNNPDNSAFDVYVEYLHNDRKYFFGIEVKYQENLFEESTAKAAENFERHRNEYTTLTNNSKYFIPNAIDHLQFVPLAQIWRDHLLAFNMTDDNISGAFIYLYPFDNDECSKGVATYQKYLSSSKENESRFLPRNLNKFILTLNEIHDTKWTRELKERYIGN